MTDRKYIYEIYKQKSFSAAAKKLFVSQPTLSIAVKRTEEKLGITIFDRNSTNLELTEEGRVFIRAIEQMNIIEETMKTELSDIAELKSGSITVCSENFVSSFIMPKILMYFFEKYPGIELSLQESNSTELKESLNNEIVDIAITHEFSENKFVSIPLFEEEILLAVPNSMLTDSLKKLSYTQDEIIKGNIKKDAVSISLFKDIPFLLLKHGNDMYWRSQNIFKDENINPKIVIYLDQMITSYNMACAGLGAAFVSDTLIKNTTNENCSYFKINSQETKRKMTIVLMKKHYISKAVNAFIEVARETYSKLK